MKAIQKNLCIIILLILTISCVENDKDLLNDFKESYHPTESDYYYWFKGSKVGIKALDNVYYIAPQNTSAGAEIPETVIDVTSILLENSSSFDRFNKKPTNWRLIYIPNDSRTTSTIQDLKNSSDISIAPVFGESIENCIPTSEFFYAKTLSQDREKLFTFAKENNVETLLEFMPNWFLLKAPTNSNGLEMSNLFYESGVAAEVDPGFLINYQPSKIPSDPLFKDQYYIDMIMAPSGWDLTQGNSSIKVAIIDTGIDRKHNEIANNISYDSYDMMHSSHELYYYSEHGTQVTGIVASNHNDFQIAGVAPNVTIISVGVNMSDPYRPYTPWNLASAINYATNNGADIINCSWGDYGGNITEFKTASAVMEEAISNALTNGRNGKGAIVVFAAGNANKPTVDYPASCNDDILVVGSINKDKIKSHFSSYGYKIDVVAPGEDILSIVPEQGTDYITGTSASAPQVSGTAALILSVNPTLTGDQVRNIIESSATPIFASRFDLPNVGNGYLENTRGKNGWRNGVYGYGIINIDSALQKAKESK